MNKTFPDNINYLRTMAELFYKADDFESSIQYYDLIFEKIDKIGLSIGHYFILVG